MLDARSAGFNRVSWKCEFPWICNFLKAWSIPSSNFHKTKTHSSPSRPSFRRPLFSGRLRGARRIVSRSRFVSAIIAATSFHLTRAIRPLNRPRIVSCPLSIPIARPCSVDVATVGILRTIRKNGWENYCARAVYTRTRFMAILKQWSHIECWKR